LVAKCVQVLDRFLDGYAPDGGCDEGPGYWQAAGGAMFDALELLHSATGGQLDVYDEPLIHNLGHYICDAHVANEWALNFGDGTARARPNAALVYRYGKRTNDAALIGYGAWLGRRGRSGATSGRGNLGRQLAGIFCREEMLAAEPVEPLARDVFLPD